jgi:3-phosphoshikimate 1-carboxyvinyltransferase
MDELFGALEENGAAISGKGTAEITVCGRLSPGAYRLRGDISSQYISGLLFALPLLEEDSEIAITGPIESKGYIEATLSALRVFGLDMKLESGRIRVPGGRRGAFGGERVIAVEGLV